MCLYSLSNDQKMYSIIDDLLISDKLYINATSNTLCIHHFATKANLQIRLYLFNIFPSNLFTFLSNQKTFIEAFSSWIFTYCEYATSFCHRNQEKSSSSHTDIETKKLNKQLTSCNEWNSTELESSYSCYITCM